MLQPTAKNETKWYHYQLKMIEKIGLQWRG